MALNYNYGKCIICKKNKPVKNIPMVKTPYGYEIIDFKRARNTISEVNPICRICNGVLNKE